LSRKILYSECVVRFEDIQNIIEACPEIMSLKNITSVDKFTSDLPISPLQSPSHLKIVSFYILEMTNSSLIKAVSELKRKRETISLA